MMSPSSLAVFALKFLQKSMMLTPCGPSAVPTGGAGVALPAAIWSFTTACTFLAIALIHEDHEDHEDDEEPTGFGALRVLRSLRASNLFNLQEVQFHGRGAPED